MYLNYKQSTRERHMLLQHTPMGSITVVSAELLPALYEYQLFFISGRCPRTVPAWSASRC
jgi:hypothetical protein